MVQPTIGAIRKIKFRWSCLLHTKRRPRLPCEYIYRHLIRRCSSFAFFAGICHRDISLENILMDTRIPERGSASRSSSVSSIASCVSAASSTGFSDAGSCRDGSAGTAASGLGSATLCSSFDTPHLEIEASERREMEAGHWVGRPRLCDFGMSVRIPRSPVTGRWLYRSLPWRWERRVA